MYRKKKRKKKTLCTSPIISSLFLSPSPCLVNYDVLNQWILTNPITMLVETSINVTVYYFLYFTFNSVCFQLCQFSAYVVLYIIHNYSLLLGFLSSIFGFHLVIWYGSMQFYLKFVTIKPKFLDYRYHIYDCQIKNYQVLYL